MTELTGLPKEDQTVVKVYLAIPNVGHAPVEAYANRMENCIFLGMLQERSQALGWKICFQFFLITLGRLLPSLAREEAARICLEGGGDYLYMIDDDMICPSDMFERLFRHNVDVVAPLAFTRNYPHHAVIYDIKEGWDPVAKQDYFINHHVTEYPDNSLVECDAVGFGAALIKASVLRDIPEPRFMSSCGTGEDILFCHKARKAGHRVFMDTSVKLGHLASPINVTEEYVKEVRDNKHYKEVQPLWNKYEHTLVLGD